jgi:hypothetical protein
MDSIKHCSQRSVRQESPDRRNLSQVEVQGGESIDHILIDRLYGRHLTAPRVPRLVGVAELILVDASKQIHKGIALVCSSGAQLVVSWHPGIIAFCRIINIVLREHHEGEIGVGLI